MSDTVRKERFALLDLAVGMEGAVATEGGKLFLFSAAFVQCCDSGGVLGERRNKNYRDMFFPFERLERTISILAERLILGQFGSLPSISSRLVSRIKAYESGVVFRKVLIFNVTCCLDALVISGHVAC